MPITRTVPSTCSTATSLPTTRAPPEPAGTARHPMFWNNVKIALRNLRKNKGFAAINITGLAIGLTVYVFGGLIVEYERTHDQFYANADRIYTIGATAAPELNVGVTTFNAVQSIVGPSIEANIPDVEAVA